MGALALGFDSTLPRARAAMVGVALLLPGLLSCLLSPRHFVDHAFWSMPAVAGAAVFAAVVPVLAISSLERTTRPRFLPVCALLLALAAMTGGVATTLRLIDRFRPAHSSFSSLVDEAASSLGGVVLVLTNCDVPMRPFVPGALFLGNVRTGTDLENWLSYGRSQGIAAELAFLLDSSQADPTLVERLDRLSSPVRTKRTATYRFHP